MSMKRCLRCHGPCDSPSSFCEQCRSNSQTSEPFQAVEETLEPLSCNVDNQADNNNIADNDNILDVPAVDRGEQSLHYLNAAAQRIEEVTPRSSQNLRSLRSARLSPLHDISGEIRRSSTPLPATAYSTFPHHAFDLPDTDPSDQWPWDEALDGIAGIDDSDNNTADDLWAGRPDPLAARHFPSMTEGLRVEEEDMRQILDQRRDTRMVAVQKRPHRYLRLLLIWVMVCALVALVVDAALIPLLGRNGLASANGQPTLTLSKSKVRYGDTVVISLHNFTPAGQVMLSRNIGESVSVATGSSLVRVGVNGSLNVTMYIRPNWDPGQQMIEAEDVHTHYTASAMLLLGSGQPLSAHLSVSRATLNFGQQVQGNTSIESLNLVNTGGGTISWSASSQSSWLMVTPAHGLFSDEQTIQVAADRSQLKPGDYTGGITIVSNVGAPVVIHAYMTVLPIPTSAGAVLDVTPAVLSFTAIDGGSDPVAQSLSIANIGHKDLYWEIDPQSLQQQSTNIDPLVATSTNWLHFQTTSGKIAPGASASISVQVYSRALLQGTFIGVITFRSAHGHTMYNDPQQVAVSLTVQPRCGVLLSTGSMAFTTVAGQSTANQTLNLTSSLSCQGAVNWSSLISSPWLSLSPDSGSITGATPEATTVNVNATGMAPGTYNGFVSVTVDHSSQSIVVQLIVQGSPTPTPDVPVMGVAPLSLNFTPPAGSTGMTSQAVGITNTGGSTLLWHASVPSELSWLSLGQSSGSIPPGGSAHLLVNVTPGNLSPNVYAYTGQVTLTVADTSGSPIAGSPQVVAVTLVVSAPCTIALPSSSSLAFNATQGGGDPASMQVTIAASGNCAWPLTWKALSDSPSWLSLSPASGFFNTSGQSATIMVSPTIQGQLAGTDRGSIGVVVSDNNGNTVSNVPNAVNVVLNILTPCAFQASANAIPTVNVVQGQKSATQVIGLSVSGNCSLPVSWSASSSTAVGGNWLSLLTTSGLDSGNGSVLLYQADATALSPGVYSGTINFQAYDSSGTALRSVVPIAVLLNVSGYTVSGSVALCDGAGNCTPDVGDTLTLTGSTGSPMIAICAADGTFQFTNVANGSYVLTANDTLTTYSVNVNNGSATVTVTVATTTTTSPMSSATPSASS
jgi:hypothetical protein